MGEMKDLINEQELDMEDELCLVCGEPLEDCICEEEDE